MTITIDNSSATIKAGNVGRRVYWEDIEWDRVGHYGTHLKEMA